MTLKFIKIWHIIGVFFTFISVDNFPVTVDKYRMFSLKAFTYYECFSFSDVLYSLLAFFIIARFALLSTIRSTITVSSKISIYLSFTVTIISRSMFEFSLSFLAILMHCLFDSTIRSTETKYVTYL